MLGAERVSTIPFVSSIAFVSVDRSSELARLVRAGSSVGNYREVWLVASAAQSYNQRNVITRWWEDHNERSGHSDNAGNRVLLFCDARQSRHHTWQGSHSCQDSDVYCSKFCAGFKSQLRWSQECEQDIVPEISANNLSASCQHWAPWLRPVPGRQTRDFYEEENIDVLYIIISRIISLSLKESLFDLYHLIIIREAERSSIWSLIGWWWGEINNTYFRFGVASSHAVRAR